jgi:glycogen synthase
VEKTRYKDLVVINYRFGGLAEKILETHQIVLVNRSKIGAIFTKEHRLDLLVWI